MPPHHTLDSPCLCASPRFGCCSFFDFRRHLDDVVSGCSELETCSVWDSVEGTSKQGVRITLRMRLHCELWR